MFLSVIIPVYNVEKYLNQCVDSVLSQLPDDSEIILIDDGSTDSSPAICDTYSEKDFRVRTIHQENSGASTTRNNGLKTARGEYVFFLDSDDYLTEGFFEKLISYKADLIISNFTAFYTDGTPDFSLALSNAQKAYTLTSFLNDFHLFFPTVFNFPWGKIYRRDILINNNILFDPTIAINEDLLFNLEYYIHCDSIFFESDALVKYRQIPGSLSHKYYPKLFEWYLKGYTKIQNLLISKKSFTDINKQHFYHKFFGNVLECLIGLVQSKTKDKRTILKKMCFNDMVQSSLSFTTSWKIKGILLSIKIKNPVLLLLNLKIYVFLLNFKKSIRRIIK